MIEAFAGMRRNCEVSERRRFVIVGDVGNWFWQENEGGRKMGCRKWD
ncbi:hypothetical protein RMSM_05112 [Rhodopirellula maiorica SM1]|uniref:Uncharacterized protein n=1 Tax=Rhodopirellula maiorica SM1 TaxID=1265738 RepID=M5RRF1_9BACT|nr:hypothetical protein RMSM_05112 [Rhodopirellula maiorica SM1]